MKVQVLCFLLVLGAALAQETYNTEKDNFDIETLAKDKDAVEKFFKCFVGQSSFCDETSSHYLKDLGEAIQQACAKCTPAQKHIMRVYLDGLKAQSPANYETFKKHFDPEDKYFAPLQIAVADF